MRTLEALTGDDDLEDTFAQATDCLAELLPAVLPAVMMEPREAEIDSLLRRSMAAPVPSLPPDFDQRLMRKVRRGSQPLDWGAIALIIPGPLAVLAAVPWARRAMEE